MSDNVQTIKDFLQWEVRISIRFYNWAYPITKIIRWQINLPARLHNRLYLDEEPIPLVK